MSRYAVVDAGSIDIGNIDSPQGRRWLADFFGCRAVKVAGRGYVLQGRDGGPAPVLDDVDIDHPRILKWLAGPLDEVAPNAVEYIHTVDDTDTAAAVAREMDAAGPEDWPDLAPAEDCAGVEGPGYTAGPLVLEYVETLHGPAAVYGRALVASFEIGGASAARPADLPAVAAALIVSDLAQLAALEYWTGEHNAPALYHDAPAYLATLAAVSARRAAIRPEMPGTINDRRRPAVAPAPVQHAAAPAARPAPVVARDALLAGPVTILATSGPLPGKGGGLVVNLCAGGVLQVLAPALGAEYRGRVDGRGTVAGLTGQLPGGDLLAVRVAALDLLHRAAA